MQLSEHKCSNTERRVEELNEILQQWYPQGGDDLQLLVPKPGSTWRSLSIVTIENSHCFRYFVLSNTHLQRKYSYNPHFYRRKRGQAFCLDNRLFETGLETGGQVAYSLGKDLGTRSPGRSLEGDTGVFQPCCVEPGVPALGDSLASLSTPGKISLEGPMALKKNV